MTSTCLVGKSPQVARQASLVGQPYVEIWFM